MKATLALCATFVVAMGTVFAADPAKDPAALALLRGVELARAKYDNLRVELVLEYADRTKKCTIPCLVEQTGGRRRFEQFAGGCLKEGVVTLVNDHEVWGYHRKKHEDLEIYDMERAVGIRGDKAFDPRILGLIGITPTADATLRELLWIETCDRIKIMGREELKGIPVWRVQSTWDETTSDFWIEEPSFRLHKRVTQCPSIHSRSESASEFGQNDRTFPFPKRVVVICEEGKDWKRLEITVKSFEVDKPIPPERFTMNSIGLPVNTMINDYRINRIVGYWNGKGVSQDPVYSNQQPSRPAPPVPKRQHRLLLIGLNVFVVLALIVAMWWRWRRKVAAAK